MSWTLLLLYASSYADVYDRNPWFYAGLGVIALVYVYMDRMAKAVDNAKLAKFMEKKAAQDSNSKKEQ